MKVVEVESNWDHATRYGFAFRTRKYVNPYFKPRVSNLVELFTARANRVEFQSATNMHDVDFVSGFGHGTPVMFTGHNGEALWQSGAYNPREVNGRIIHLLSCSIAKHLGTDLGAKGARAVLAYFEDFVFLTSDPPPTDPLNDLLAEPFFECDSDIDRLLVDGHRAQNVLTDTLTHYDTQITKWMAQDPRVAKMLRWDRGALCLVGDPNAHL